MIDNPAGLTRWEGVFRQHHPGKLLGNCASHVPDQDKNVALMGLLTGHLGMVKYETFAMFVSTVVFGSQQPIFMGNGGGLWGKRSAMKMR